jgi:SAM-dependent methyltransferase
MEKFMFKFGENWASFSKQLDEGRLEEAMQSLESLFPKMEFHRSSFLDIGSGSGLFSIAAAKLGCNPVAGIDVDPVSVEVSEANAARWLGDSNGNSYSLVSVLDHEKMNSLGQFDIVYSWGVLHHTGSMYEAIGNAAQRVTPAGSLMIAIYNRHWSSGMWWLIKWLYNHMGRLGQKVLIWIFTPIIFTAKWLVTFKNPFKMRRGMDFMHNVVDWVGGYPYEYASINEMTRFLNSIDFEVLDVRKANTPIGCNEFICRRR